MVRCAASLVLTLAGTVAPLAQNVEYTNSCPIFRQDKKNYVCDTLDARGNVVPEAGQYGLTLEVTTAPNGAPAYHIIRYKPTGTSVEKQEMNLVVDEAGQQKFAGQGVTALAACGTFENSKKVKMPSLLTTYRMKDGQMGRGVFYPQAGGIVSMTFGSQNDLRERNRCRPHIPKDKPKPQQSQPQNTQPQSPPAQPQNPQPQPRTDPDELRPPADVPRS